MTCKVYSSTSLDIIRIRTAVLRNSREMITVMNNQEGIHLITRNLGQIQMMIVLHLIRSQICRNYKALKVLIIIDVNGSTFCEFDEF